MLERSLGSLGFQWHVVNNISSGQNTQEIASGDLALALAEDCGHDWALPSFGLGRLVAGQLVVHSGR